MSELWDTGKACTPGCKALSKPSRMDSGTQQPGLSHSRQGYKWSSFAASWEEGMYQGCIMRNMRTSCGSRTFPESSAPKVKAKTADPWSGGSDTKA